MEIKDLSQHTDKYFTYTKEIVKKYGECSVIYVIFVRKPSMYAPKIALDWLKDLSLNIKITENWIEGDEVPPGEPLLYIEGSFSELSELETFILQKIGLPCLCAWNAYKMSTYLPSVEFISMVARHCANPEMTQMVEYGVSVGSKRAKDHKSKGFIGSSVDNSAPFFNNTMGMGTMPHSLIGYAKSTLNAAKMYFDTFQPSKMTVLVDYFGKELDDSFEVCEHFKDLLNDGNLYLRIDTHGARYLQGLDYDKSHDVLEKYAPFALSEYRDKESIDYLVGMGVSVATIFHFKEKLIEAGFSKAKIVASSGFNLKKCHLMGVCNAPIDVVGSGSMIPQMWSDTYATADIVSYDGDLSVKVGREYLLKKIQNK